MRTSTIYEREIKKAFVYEDGYLIASYDFNSGQFETEIEMTKAKANECMELMNSEKGEWDEFEADAYDVASEQTQR